MSSPKCPKCGGVLVPESLRGMVLYKEDDKGQRVYSTKCMACDCVTEVQLKHDFPPLEATPFQPGRRWFCGYTEANRGRARFWFVIIGDGRNYADKLSTTHKKCRLDVHPDDLRNHVPGYKTHGQVGTYSHKHLKKYAVLEPL